MSRLKLYERWLSTEGLEEDTPANDQPPGQAEVPPGGEEGNADSTGDASAAAELPETTEDTTGDAPNDEDGGDENVDGDPLTGEEDDGQIEFIKDADLDVNYVASMDAIDAREKAELEKQSVDVRDAVKDLSEAVAALEAIREMSAAGQPLGVRTQAFLRQTLSLENYGDAGEHLSLEGFRDIVRSIFEWVLKKVTECIDWLRKVIRGMLSRARYNAGQIQTRTKALQQARKERGAKIKDGALVKIVHTQLAAHEGLRVQMLFIKGKQPNSYPDELTEVLELCKSVEGLKKVVSVDLVSNFDKIFNAIEKNDPVSIEGFMAGDSVRQLIAENMQQVDPHSIKYQGSSPSTDQKLIAVGVKDLLGDVGFYHVMPLALVQDETLRALTELKGWRFIRENSVTAITIGEQEVRVLSDFEVVEGGKVASAICDQMLHMEEYLSELDKIQNKLKMVTTAASRAITAGQEDGFFDESSPNGWRGTYLRELTGAVANVSQVSNSMAWSIYQYAWMVVGVWNSYLDALTKYELSMPAKQ